MDKLKKKVDELKKQLYILYVVAFVISLVNALFLWRPSFYYLYLLAILAVSIQCIRLIIHKSYFFSIFAMIPMLFSIINFIDRNWYRLIYWADTAEVLEFLQVFSIIVFSIISMRYGIQLIKKKEYRWGVSLLGISIIAAIYLGIMVFLGIVFQGLK